MDTSVKKVGCIKVGNSSRMAIFVIYPLNFHAQLRTQHENTKQHQHKQKQDETKHGTQQKNDASNRIIKTVQFSKTFLIRHLNRRKLQPVQYLIKELPLFPTSVQTSAAADAHLRTVLFVQNRQQT